MLGSNGACEKDIEGGRCWRQGHDVIVRMAIISLAVEDKFDRSGAGLPRGWVPIMPLCIERGGRGNMVIRGLVVAVNSLLACATCTLDLTSLPTM